MRQILFVDRDGTIVKEPHDFQVDRLDKIQFVDGVILALEACLKRGYELVLVSNQDGLGTPSFPKEDFQKVHDFIIQVLKSQGVHFIDEKICPHLPDDSCTCRKPQLGLLTDYLKDPHWDRQRSAVIGDRETDLALAEAMGIRGFQIGPMSWPTITQALFTTPRTAQTTRKTKETSIHITVNLDSEEPRTIHTGIGFFDHMLDQVAKHGGFSLQIHCQGDLEIDDHHTVEDVGLALGSCLRQALGNKMGIGRYGFVLPMDEAKASAALDLSGRPHLEFQAPFSQSHIGQLATEMVPHFFSSLTQTLGATLHLETTGKNHHHMVESLFKALGRCLRQAISPTGTSHSLPSTKGTL